MKYHPTLYLPMELVHTIDLHLKPIENAMKNMLIQKPLSAASERKLVHNLNCIAEFNQEKEGLIDRYQASIRGSSLHFNKG